MPHDHAPALETLQAIARSIGERGDHPAVLALSREGAARWSYGSLSDHTRRLAAGLAASGVERGEPIAMFAPNRPEWIVAALAILEVRAVAVLIDAQVRGDDLAHYLRDSGSRRVFTVREHAERLDAIGLDPRPSVVLLDADDSDERSWRRLLAEPRDLPRAEPGDRAALFYTAGTTGPPKGVPLTHENCASNLSALLEARVATPEDRVLLPLPFHHVYPFMIGLMSVLATGATLVLPAGLTGPQIVRALREGEVTTIVGVPRFYEALVSGLEARVRARGRVVSTAFRTVLAASIGARRALGRRPGRVLFRALHREMAPRVRIVASGGAKLDPDVGWTLEGLGWEVCTGYGLTETAPILTFNVPGQSRLHTAGRPLRGVDLRLDDPDGDGAGEVQARGPNVFAGYHNLPDKTAEAFTPDGWFRTGDLGRFDADGYLEIVGRSSEIIVLAEGKHVVPEHVEKRYLEDRAIREIAVLLHEGRLAAVIVPDPREVARRKTAVEDVVRESVSQASRGLQSWERVGEYAVTRESLPRTRLGKLKRHLLPELYERLLRSAGKDAEAQRPARPEELSDEDRALLEHPTANLTWEWLVERFHDRRVTPDTSPQLDLGIDSLEWMDLTLEIRERAGVELSEEAIAEIGSVRDLLRATIDAAEAGGRPRGAAALDRPEEVLSEAQRRWLEPSGRIIRSLGVPIYAGNRALVRRLFSVTVEGFERVPEREPVIFTPNHRSLLDAFVLAAALPLPRLRQTFWGGAMDWLFTGPLTRLLSRIANVVPVDRRRAAMSSLALGAAVLQRRQSLIWFPEGGLSPTGELQRFLPGIGKLLERFKVPVVPVFIQGTERALPPDRLFRLRRAHVTVTFGDPIHPDELARRGEGKETAERITNGLREAVAELGRRAGDAKTRRRAA